MTIRRQTTQEMLGQKRSFRFVPLSSLLLPTFQPSNLAASCLLPCHPLSPVSCLLSSSLYFLLLSLLFFTSKLFFHHSNQMVKSKTSISSFFLLLLSAWPSSPLVSTIFRGTRTQQSQATWPRSCSLGGEQGIRVIQRADCPNDPAAPGCAEEEDQGTQA